MAFIIIDAPEPEPLVKRAKIQYIKAELVTIDKPKAKPVTPVTIKPKKTDDTAQKAALASKKKIEQQSNRLKPSNRRLSNYSKKNAIKKSYNSKSGKRQNAWQSSDA